MSFSRHAFYSRSTGKLIALTQGDRGSSIFGYVLKSDTPFSLVLPIVFTKRATSTS